MQDLWGAGWGLNWTCSLVAWSGLAQRVGSRSPFSTGKSCRYVLNMGAWMAMLLGIHYGDQPWRSPKADSCVGPESTGLRIYAKGSGEISKRNWRSGVSLMLLRLPQSIFATGVSAASQASALLDGGWVSMLGCCRTGARERLQASHLVLHAGKYCMQEKTTRLCWPNQEDPLINHPQLGCIVGFSTYMVIKHQQLQ